MLSCESYWCRGPRYGESELNRNCARSRQLHEESIPVRHQQYACAAYDALVKANESMLLKRELKHTSPTTEHYTYPYSHRSELRIQLGHGLEQIGDQPVVRDLKNGRLGVLVDGHDRLRVLHT